MKPILYFVKKLHHYAGQILYRNMLAMMCMSLLEGIGILFLIPMIHMLDVAQLNLTGTPLDRLVDSLYQIPNQLGLPLILLIYVVLVSTQYVLQRNITIRNAIIQHSFFRHLRLEVYGSLLYANWGFFLKKRKSDLIHLMTSEIATASSGAHSFLQLTAGLIFTIIQIGIAFWLSPSITIFVLISGSILVLLSRQFLKKSFALGQRTFESGRRYLGGITDQINGIKDLKSNSLEKSRLYWFQEVTKDMQNEQVEYTKLSSKSQMLYKIASAVCVAVFVYVAAKLFHAQTPQLILIILIFSRLWPRVAGIQAAMEQMAARIPSYQAVIDVQQESTQAQEYAVVDEDAEILPLQLKHGITCDHIYFRYDQNKLSYALQDIHAFFPANQMTAVIGRSGAGKSTLIDMIMGLNEPERGRLLIDGHPLQQDQLLAYRKAISYVPQDPFLFHESIRENLLLAQPAATEKQLWEALSFASADKFVQKLPNQLDTMIGDRGIRLSGGERQRLVLARAILRRPSILILDEATSALDTHNEIKIQEALEQLKGKMTLIVIAHRLSTIRHADQVIVLDQGRIMQQEAKTIPFPSVY